MDKIAIEAARGCIERAEQAIHNMENADSLAKTEAAWADFLIMANRVYTKLEQGAKSHPKSKSWFGLKKHERRNDPLLKYIKNARDADEHGLSKVTKREPPRTITTWGHIEAVDGDSIRLTPQALSEPPKITQASSPERIHLVDVFNYGDKYEPPGDLVPTSVAKKAVKHLESLIAEAEGL